MKFEQHIAAAALAEFDGLAANCRAAVFMAEAVADPKQECLRGERCNRDEFYSIAYASGLLNGIALALAVPVKELVAAMEWPDQVDVSRLVVMAIAKAAKERTP
jgi:hypothetical protein